MTHASPTALEIPAKVHQAIDEIVSKLSGEYQHHAKEALEAAWNGTGICVIIQSGSGPKFHAQWKPSGRMYLGSVLVVVEESRYAMEI